MKRRVFVSFPLENGIKSELEDKQKELIKLNRHTKVNWVSPDNFHVTLQFLGEIEDSTLEIVKNIVQDIAQEYSPLRFELDCLNAFPNLQHPKTIVISVFDHERTSNRLQKKLTDMLVNKGIKVDMKLWKPHITLARNPLGYKLVGLQQIELKALSWSASSIVIMESILSQAGAQYRRLDTIQLQANHI